jgi:proton translocating ATP synthase F1 alpha subunit
MHNASLKTNNSKNFKPQNIIESFEQTEILSSKIKKNKEKENLLNESLFTKPDLVFPPFFDESEIYNSKKPKPMNTSYVKQQQKSQLLPKVKFSKKKPVNLDTRLEQPEIVGTVSSSIDGVIKIKNLSSACVGELITYGQKGGVKGIVLNLEKDYTTAIVFGNDKEISQGTYVFLEKQLMGVVASRVLKGHIVNSLGELIDGSNLNLKCETFNSLMLNQRIETFKLHNFDESELFLFPDNAVYINNKLQSVEAPAPSIMNRLKITEPLYTGTIIIDSMIPIGKGQRELIIGDRKIGKTTLAIDTIINQSILLKRYGYFGDSLITSVYVAIGQRKSSVLKIFTDLQFTNALHSTIIVSSTASDSASLQFLAPYSGTAYGEFFRDSSKHALVIYDDLSKHAVAYRQMSLLLRRSPGREAYPADIFYLHSRLLERSAATKIGTLTALPVVETLSGDVSSFIPTNVISITDGQIFLETDLFYKGIRPAINIGLSVSRIGSAAQNDALKRVASRLKLDLVQYKHIEIFAMFASDLDATTQHLLNRGVRIIELLKQKPGNPLHPLGQAILIYSGIHGFLDFLSIHKVILFKELIFKASLNGSFPITSFDELAFGNIKSNFSLNTYIVNLIKTID